MRGKQLGLSLLIVGAGAIAPAQERYFGIEVVDAETGRGVPLVELHTVHELRWVTDSAGLVAIAEPGLMNKDVFLHVKSHGYEVPKDGFGYRGFRVRMTPGGTKVLRIQRRNVAERLYRMTGEGIYRDSVLLGRPTPIREPLLRGGVLGQDSVVNAIHRGRLLWFWGDTNRASYPLGNFAVSGAFSRLPGDGGLDPARGVDLTYWVDERGFSRKMCPIEGPGPVWIGGLMVLTEKGEDRLVCHYARMKNLGTRHEHGLAVFDDETETFRRLRRFPLDVPLHPLGHPVRVREENEEWFWFPSPYPAIRVRAQWAHVVDPTKYEAFTCFVLGSRGGTETPAVDRDNAGTLRWGWKADTRAVTPKQGLELEKRGLVDPRESWLSLRDVETGSRIQGHGGSVFWNDHRRRWVMIALQSWGRSMLGEVFYAEGDTPLGPWTYARRIVTHDDYSFYNVKHHPYFDQARFLYFEGTYTAMFSAAKTKTPRYDYNQIMYRLDLDDPRLALPAPVYRVEVGGRSRWLGGPAVAAGDLWASVVDVPFYALPADRPAPGSVPVVDAGGELRRGAPAEFRVLPWNEDAPSPGATVALWSWSHPDGRYRYLPAPLEPGSGWQRGKRPVARVWPSPNRRPPLAPKAQPGR